MLFHVRILVVGILRQRQHDQVAILTEIGAKKTRFAYAGRKASASPATGLASRHKYEQETLVKEALG